MIFHRFAIAMLWVSILPLCAGIYGGYKCANDSTYDEKLFNKFAADGSTSTWKVRHDSNIRLYRKHKCKVCVEIGVARGEFSHKMLENVHTITEYYGIDPFLGGYDPHDAMSVELKQYRGDDKDPNTVNRWANAVLYNLRQFGCKFRLYQGFSDDMKVKFPNNSIDCIFIDGDHTYKRAMNDILNYTPLMAPHGVIMFDDYNFPGVEIAVRAFGESSGLDVRNVNEHHDYGQYYVVIPATGGSSVKLPVFNSSIEV